MCGPKQEKIRDAFAGNTSQSVGEFKHKGWINYSLKKQNEMLAEYGTDIN